MSELPSKKRKQPTTNADPHLPAKKSKKEDLAPIGKTDRQSRKGKRRDKEFHVVRATIVLSVPPIFANNPKAGIEEMLDSMIMRYIPALRGVVLSHSNLRFLTRTAVIQADCPYLICNVVFDAVIWSPHIGMKLVGKVNLCSPDHVSLLIHRTFNVSIPRHHIPKDTWEFEYGPAENDPEYGPNANGVETTLDQQEGGEGEGKWVHHLTNEKLGGADGFLEFTVIGLTVANEMLSLLGSIQSDPFSAEHVPETPRPTEPPQVPSEIEDDEMTHNSEMEGAEEDEIESGEDTFKALGKMTDQAAAAVARAKREAMNDTSETKQKKKRHKPAQLELIKERKQKKRKTKLA